MTFYACPLRDLPLGDLILLLEVHPSKHGI